jgi:hypothetical protein
MPRSAFFDPSTFSKLLAADLGYDGDPTFDASRLDIHSLISRRANFRAAEKFEKNPVGGPRRRLTTLFATI